MSADEFIGILRNSKYLPRFSWLEEVRYLCLLIILSWSFIFLQLYYLLNAVRIYCSLFYISKTGFFVFIRMKEKNSFRFFSKYYQLLTNLSRLNWFLDNRSIKNYSYYNDLKIFNLLGSILVAKTQPSQANIVWALTFLIPVSKLNIVKKEVLRKLKKKCVKKETVDFCCSV